MSGQPRPPSAQSVNRDQTFATPAISLPKGGEAARSIGEEEVASHVSAAVGGLDVQIMDKGVGGDVQVAKAVTDERGAYRVTFTYVAGRRGKTRPDLRAQVFDGGKLLASSDVRYDAKQREILNVRLDDRTAGWLRSRRPVSTWTTLRTRSATTVRSRYSCPRTPPCSSATSRRSCSWSWATPSSRALHCIAL